MDPMFPMSCWDDHPDALLALAPDGRVLDWNRAAEVLYGYARDEAVGRDVQVLIAAAAQAGEEAALRSRAMQGDTGVQELVRRRKDGSLLYVNVSVSVVRNPAGEVAHLLCSHHDVTEMRVLRDAKLLEARFRDLLESTPDAMVMVNLTGRIVMANGQAERVFGYGRDELLGQPVELLLPQHYRQAHVRHRSQFFAQPRTRTMGAGLELNGRRKDGSEFPVEISLSPLQTEEGLFVSSAIRDVTERKRIESVLREKNLELENAARVKDRFLASMSHELRTPLNAVIGFTGTLLMQLPGPLNDEQERQLRMVQTGARHLLSLINDLLDVAKLSAGKLAVDREAVDCAAVAAEAVATLEPEAHRKGLVLALHVPAGPVWLQTDRRALSQILLNLVGNAVKFTAHGRIDVELTCGEPDALGSTSPGVRFTVRDTGPGIPAHERPQLFQAFSRIERPGAGPQEGTGLGMHLSSQLAQALGGHLGVESTEGQGSVFTLALAESVA
ncbi:PAS domain-containing sensor histidine kinase [Acidovorax sp. RAC01]|uniref:PAS domain-containing sensor histidine kinase n=1 Tax=Acidovorax sp. RAC01 TaxID=1842533 RepID=UPI00083E885C|nr:PAS domain S-box protein [Acidovorax sp. RAC01]AOG23155.1 sensory box protein [Acidovorax sp. RAC01]